MPFKIVETEEGGEKQLCICPDGWVTVTEDGEKLSWPNKKADKKSKIEDSKPEKGWFTLWCKVKRYNIKSYEEANKEIEIMTQSTETEEEHIENRGCSNREELEADFNYLLDSHQCVEETNAEAETPIVLVNIKSGDYELQDMDLYNIGNEAHAEAEAEYQPEAQNNDEVTNHTTQRILESIVAGQKVILQKLDNVITVQKKLSFKVAEVSVDVKNLQSQQTKHVTLLDDVRVSVSNTKFVLKPIETESELRQLEQELSNELNKRELLDRYSIVCKKGKAIDVAYQLCDVLFSREFIAKCSWTGCSRGEGIKTPLKCFTNTLQFFFELVIKCDPTYTINDNTTFFKKIAKNGKKRVMSKLMRASTQRCSPKRPKIDKNFQDEIGDIENNEEQATNTEKARTSEIVSNKRVMSNLMRASTQRCSPKRLKIDQNFPDEIGDKENNEEQATNTETARTSEIDANKNVHQN